MHTRAQALRLQRCAALFVQIDRASRPGASSIRNVMVPVGVGRFLVSAVTVAVKTTASPGRVRALSATIWTAVPLSLRSCASEIGSREALVASRGHVEHAVRDADPSSSPPCRSASRLRDRDARRRSGCSGDLELRLQHARRLLGWPVPVGERRGRRPRRVHEQARLVGHAPGVGEGLVERDVAIVQASAGLGPTVAPLGSVGSHVVAGMLPMIPSSAWYARRSTSR